MEISNENELDNLISYNLNNILSKHFNTEIDKNKTLESNLQFYLNLAFHKFKSNHLLTLLNNIIPTISKKSTKKITALLLFFIYNDFSFTNSDFSKIVYNNYEIIFEKLYKASTSISEKSKIRFNLVPTIINTNLENGSEIIYYDFIEDYLKLTDENKNLKNEIEELKSKILINEEHNNNRINEIYKKFEEKFLDLKKHMSYVQNDLDKYNKEYDLQNNNLSDLKLKNNFLKNLKGSFLLPKNNESLIKHFETLDKQILDYNEKIDALQKVNSAFFVQVVTKELILLINPKICLDYLGIGKGFKEKVDTELEIVFDKILNMTKEVISGCKTYTIQNLFQTIKADYMLTSKEVEQITEFENLLYKEIFNYKYKI
jgi:hypothetical protein